MSLPQLIQSWDSLVTHVGQKLATNDMWSWHVATCRQQFLLSQVGISMCLQLLYPNLNHNFHQQRLLYFLFLFEADIMSEVTIKYQILRQFVDWDETHHLKLSKGDKGGPQANTLTHPNLPWAGTQLFQDAGGHVTVIYGSNPLEPMPPVVFIKQSPPKRKTCTLNQVG